MAPHPLLYEINTRAFLSDHLAAGPIQDIPEDHFHQWSQLGFTHIWLMGVWKCGPVLRGAEHEWAKLLPDFQPEDVVASPYAITDYTVAPQLGGDAGLRAFRQRLHEHGLKLILDFVPNHTSSTHTWTRERPEFYVHAHERRPDTFATGERRIADGKNIAAQRHWPSRQWLAHGKDPYFPAWVDTAQLDYRNPETREAMTEQLMQVAKHCDGVRCDMSMLLLNDVFEKTWQAFPTVYPPPSEEFWPQAIATVKRQHPSFLLLAEAYWDLEARLLEHGFDFVYDKRVYDHLVARNPGALHEHFRSRGKPFFSRTAHFLENHDEPRAAAVLGLNEHRCASLLVLALPGLRLLHEGQLTGARLRASVHLRRRAAELADHKLSQWYENLLLALQNSTVGKGEFDSLDTGCAEVFALHWRENADRFDLALVNYSDALRPFKLPLTPGLWTCTDLLASSEPQTCQGIFHARLEPFATRLLRFVKQP